MDERTLEALSILRRVIDRACEDVYHPDFDRAPADDALEWITKLLKKKEISI